MLNCYRFGRVQKQLVLVLAYIAGSFSMISSKFTVTVYMLQQIQVKAVHHAADPLVQNTKDYVSKTKTYIMLFSL